MCKEGWEMQISNMWPAKLNMLNPREDVNKKSAEGQERWSQICLPIMNERTATNLQLQTIGKWTRSIPQSLYYLISQAGSQVEGSVEWSQHPVGSNGVALFSAERGSATQVKEGKWSHRQAGSGIQHVSPVANICLHLSSSALSHRPQFHQASF